MTFIGWLGSLLLAVCAIPQAWEAWRTKQCSVNVTFLVLWLGGEIFALIYAIHIEESPLILNYIINLFCIAVLLRYRSHHE